MSRIGRALAQLPLNGPRAGAGAVLVVAGLLVLPARAVDVATLRTHAEGRVLLHEGDVEGAQGVWDSLLRNRRGSLHAVVLEGSCDAAAFGAAVQRHRALQPTWVAGSDCLSLLWGAFESEEEARAQLAALPRGLLPEGASLVELVPPLAGLRVTTSEPAEPIRVAARAPRVEPEVVPEVEPEVVPEVEPEVVPEVEPEVVPEVEPEVVPEIEPEVVPEVEPETPEVEPEVEPETAPMPAVVREQREEPDELAPPAAGRETVLVPEAPPRRPAEPPVQRPAEPPAQGPVEPLPKPPPRRVPEAAPPLPEEPEGLSEEELGLRHERAAASFAAGNALWAGGDYEGAIEAFELALELDPTNARILNNLGTAWLKAERPERAVAVLQRAVDVDPLYSRAYLNLSTAYYAAGRPGDALLSLQRVIDLEPENLDARYNKAAVLAELRRYEEARLALNEGLQVAPGDPRLTEFLRQVDQQVAALAAGGVVGAAGAGPCADLSSDLQRGRRAAELFREGEAATARGEWKEAESAYLGVLDCDPTSSPAANRLGVARLSAGRSEAALAAFELAARLDPSHLEARVNRCLATFATQSCSAAVDCLQVVVDSAPDVAAARREHALMLYRCGRSIEAESAAVRGLELDPNDDRLRRLLQRIEGERVSAPR